MTAARNPIAMPDSPRDTTNNARAVLDCLTSLIGSGRGGVDLDAHEAYGLVLLLQCVSEAISAEVGR
jgi:hypothetical protein